MSTTTGDGSTAPPPAGRPSTSAEAAGAPQGTVVTLSAEQVDVAVHRLPRERVRLRREIHTRQVEVTVTVRREVLRIERLPVEDGGPDGPAGPAHDAPLEITLHEERPVVAVEAVPYERVRIAVDAVPLTSRVDTTTRREVVDVTTEPAHLEHSARRPAGTPSEPPPEGRGPHEHLR
ncbi:DUF2382 domain-containing protein [Streptomyces sp. NP160]|uniref:YsnF/AvaK domain-containing protein n=1 Tax=Streptomyces sp. NP160 TaxID=2586637 RepID=UPI0011192671|nr:YsnF/AvaK domain-containing protein [Streptomyces sp. NP160]TNM67360.1 DUF2382 domain-containing protein [Streptomyces sp. NP160]